MDLAECLAQGATCMDLAPQRRDEALRALLDELVASQALPAGLVDQALDALLEREHLGSTAIGKGVAVPHARVDELERIAVAFGHSQTGVEFKALDSEPVHEVFLVLAPPGGGG